MGKLSRELRMGIHNRFDIEVVDVETGEVKQRARAFNVICNGIFDVILRRLSSTNWESTTLNIAFGGGSGTPSASDTALFSYIGNASDNAAYSPYDTFNRSREADGIWYRQIKRSIPNTEHVGSTITEVGLQTSGSSTATLNKLCSHAMLQDMNGNPISIVHTSTDIINVYSTLYLHYEGQNRDIHLYMDKGYNQEYQGLVKSILLYNTSSSQYYSYWGKTMDYRAYEKPTRMGVYQGTGFDGNTKTVDYTQKTLTMTRTQVPIGTFNANGLPLLSFYDWNYNDSSYASSIDCIIEGGGSAISPARITGESVGVGDGSTVKFKTKVHCPYNATVYINGAAVTTGVVVNKHRCDSVSHTASSTDPEVFDKWGRGVYPDNVALIKPFYYSNVPIQKGEVREIRFPDIGVYNLYGSYIEGSNDGENWVSVTGAGSGQQMDQSYAHYRYYRNAAPSNVSNTINVYFNDYDGYNIIFDNPPAQGDVITIDYTTDHIPKDSDHVLDVELTFTFGEWTGE